MARKPPPSKKPATAPKANKSKPKAQAATAALGGTEQPSAPSALQSPVEQQRLLDLFSDAFSQLLSSDQFPVLLQEIKQALFNRDFAAAFGREDYLEAYAARWSPTRALCYAAVFLSIRDQLDDILVDKVAEAQNEFGQHGDAKDAIEPTPDTTVVAVQPTTDASGHEDALKDKPGEDDAVYAASGAEESSSRQATTKSLDMISIGGCAAEHIAFASYLQTSSIQGHITLLDSAPWNSVTATIASKITSPPRISKYASAAARAANHPLLAEGQIGLHVSQQDVLSLDAAGWEALLSGGSRSGGPVVVTLLFTLNELYTSGGIGKTTKFLKALGQALPDRSLVLVLDSPGSYSEAALGKEKKKYPMQWLLDHTLLETEATGYSWAKLESHDSIWFRLPEELSYPIPLENMRYQMHLYRLEKSF